jgi:hypothetical protein
VVQIGSALGGLVRKLTTGTTAMQGVPPPWQRTFREGVFAAQQKAADLSFDPRFSYLLIRTET